MKQDKPRVDETKYNTWNSLPINEVFEISLDKYAKSIKTYTDFNDYTFWQQINYYKNYFKDNKSLYVLYLKAIHKHREETIND